MLLRTRSLGYWIMGLFIIFFFYPKNVIEAQTLWQERNYEPVVLEGSVLSPFYGFPTDEIFVYAYDGNSQTWHMIPFQIDEKTYGIDPFNEPRNRWFYFIPAAWDIDEHDHILGDHDELVFMLKDMGDRAPDRAWIDNDEAKTHARLELTAHDPVDPDQKAYAYLFRSSTIQEAVPSPYGFEYLEVEDRISTGYYTLGLNVYGLLKDMVIKEPGGNGQDIFDVEKVRFGGIIDLALPIEITLTEESLYIYDDILVTPKPVVRLIRQARQTLKIGSFISEDTPFYLEAKFYPFSAGIEAGASITTEDLSQLYPNTEISIIVNSMRHSWDFNANATGMSFFNAHNDGIPVDGQPDAPDHTIDLPIREWSFISGTPGSVFWHFALQETNWDTIELYYHDDQEGGQADSQHHGDVDTGDQMSYGDHGILFVSSGRDNLDLDLDLLIYLIPEINLLKSDGEKLAGMVENPVQVTSTMKSDVSFLTTLDTPRGFILHQNHPNPFNASTHILFTLLKREKIRLHIIDGQGRIVRTLMDQTLDPGQHEIQWNGRDDFNQKVASGIYLIQLNSKNHTQTKKLMLIQ